MGHQRSAKLARRWLVLKLRKYQLAAQASGFLPCLVLLGDHYDADCRIHSLARFELPQTPARGASKWISAVFGGVHRSLRYGMPDPLARASS